MGPGGPPGLQNRVVSRKRDGRFDPFPSPPAEENQSRSKAGKPLAKLVAGGGARPAQTWPMEGAGRHQRRFRCAAAGARGPAARRTALPQPLRARPPPPWPIPDDDRKTRRPRRGLCRAAPRAGRRLRHPPALAHLARAQRRRRRRRAQASRTASLLPSRRPDRHRAGRAVPACAAGHWSLAATAASRSTILMNCELRRCADAPGTP